MQSRMLPRAAEATALRWVDSFALSDPFGTDGVQVLLDGVDVKKLPLDWLRSQVGLVSQVWTL